MIISQKSLDSAFSVWISISKKCQMLVNIVLVSDGFEKTGIVLPLPFNFLFSKNWGKSPHKTGVTGMYFSMSVHISSI